MTENVERDSLASAIRSGYFRISGLPDDEDWEIADIVLGWMRENGYTPPQGALRLAWDAGYEAGAEDQAEIEGHRYKPDEPMARGHVWAVNPYAD